MAKKNFDELDDDGFDDSDPFKAVGEEASVRTLEEFEEEVERKMKIVLSRKMSAEQRIDAAYWLGDSGAPKAIQALRTVYLGKEKDKRVKAAVTYALGQFRALDQAIKRDEDESVQEALGKTENQWIMELLTEIALQDKRGKALSIPTRTLVIAQVILLFTLVGLVVANLAMGGGMPSAPEPTPTMIANLITTSPARPVITQVQNNVNFLRADSILLVGEVDAVAAGNLLNCGLQFNNPAAVTFDPALAAQYPAVNTLVTSYNQQQTAIGVAKSAYDAGCARETKTLIAMEQNAIRTTVDALNISLTDIQGRQVTEALNEVSTVESGLQATATAFVATAAAANPNATLPPTMEISATPSPTETPGPTATATLNFRIHTGALFSLIDDTREKNNQLRTHLEGIRDRNDLAGCRLPAAVIQSDYVLPAEDGLALPRLQEAVTQVNAALPLARTGWDLFTKGCTDGSITANLTTAFTVVDTVEAALVNAESILSEFR